MLIVLALGTAIAALYHAARRKTDLPALRIFARMLVFVSSKKAAGFEYRITFNFGCPSFNYSSTATLITFDFMDKEGTVTEGRINDLIVSDTHITSALNTMKRGNRLTKDKFDRVRVFLTRKGGVVSRLFLYNIVVEDVSQRDRPVAYPIMGWVGHQDKVFHLNPGNKDFQKPHVSLPRMSLHEHLFFVIFASSVVALVTCLLPVVEKTTVFQCALSTAVGIVTGLLILSFTIFNYRMLIVKREADIAFNPQGRSVTEKSNPKQLIKRFNKYKARCFGLMILLSLGALIAATIITFRVDDWSVNAWTVCAVAANSVVILIWLIVTQKSLYTATARKLSMFFAKKKQVSAHKTTSQPGIPLLVASTIRDDPVHDEEQVSKKSHSKKRHPPPSASTHATHDTSPASQALAAPESPGSKSSHSSSGSDGKNGERKKKESTASPAAVPKPHVHSGKRKKSNSTASTGSRDSHQKEKGKKGPPPILGITFPVSDVPSTTIPNMPPSSAAPTDEE